MRSSRYAEICKPRKVTADGQARLRALHCAIFILALLFIITTQPLVAQSDSVDVTFRYTPSTPQSSVTLPGEFNGWNTSAWPMTPIGNNTFIRTARLRVGGHIGGRIPGAYQYKFYYPGASPWPNDPLNQYFNPADNDNSIIYVKDPTIYHFIPNQRTGLVKSNTPVVSAYLFPKVGSLVDTGSIVLKVGSRAYTGLGSYYDFATKRFTFRLPDPLPNGQHKIWLSAGSNTDSVTITVQAGVVQILTQSNNQVHFPTKTIEGAIEDTTVTTATLVHNDTDSTTIAVHGGLFSTTVTLSEGVNTYKVIAVSGGQVVVSTPVQFTYIVDHTPKAIFTPASAGVSIILMNQSTDPDGDSLTYRWSSDDAANPVALHFSSTEKNPSLPKPTVAGEYYFTLEAQDPEGHIGRTRNYFTVDAGGGVSVPTINSNPQWVKDAIVYEIFVKSFSSAGTLDAIRQRLPYLRSLGVNVLWLMPIMVNRTATNEINAGYDIIDFYDIAPQFGTLESFRTLADSAHKLGIKIILDITPNHVSDQHPWVNDVRVYGKYSNYRNFIETRLLGDARDLGQYITYYGGEPLYAHYDGWGLANLNLSDPEAKLYMIEMFKWWIIEQHADGYRMDVYWGPQNRYGKDAFWRPFREQIKNLKPDIFILGETDGTGYGSENNYADGGGACDAAYDWNFYGTIKNTLSGGGSLNDLDTRITNYGYSPGANSYFLRFLENHDETRIAQLYSIEQTKAGAVTIFTIPGIPMIYAGQEVGWKGRRNLIDFNNPDGKTLFPFYQRLTRTRTMFPAFRARDFKRISSSEGTVYAFLRPYKDQNAIVSINFSNSARGVTLNINESDLSLSNLLESGKLYYLNDVLNDTSYAVTKSSLANFQLSLPPWGSAVMVLADSAFRLVVKVDEKKNEQTPMAYELFQNYPNPFNPQTTINYQLSRSGQVRLTVSDVLGREVATLVNEHQPVGRYSVQFDGSKLASGVYLYWLKVVSDELQVYNDLKKMVLLR